MLNALLRRTSRRAARYLHQHILPLQGTNSVVSFTFDDAPASACSTGAKILTSYGAHGTFYVAGGLTDQLEEGHACHSIAQLSALLAAGHELGCHSFSHVHCDALSTSDLKNELTKNANFLATLGVDPHNLNFAYPFGAYGLGAKSVCAQRFRSARITGGGPHIGKVDLQALQTFRLYQDSSANTGITTFEEALSLTVRHHGWLILNTHDIETRPSRYGYTPENLDKVVAASVAAGCKILSISEAINYWQSQHRANV
jgi:peptidoglycan/xylan/chitin deacetylase (PgdA/CDA1 family)